MAAAKSLAELAREPIPQQVKDAYSDRTFEFGKNYVIPTPFDPRLIYKVTKDVAKAAIDSGIAQVPITNWDEYHVKLSDVAKDLEKLRCE